MWDPCPSDTPRPAPAAATVDGVDERRVVVVGYDRAELLDIACVTTTFAAANRFGAAPAYRVELATPGGAAITCDTGLVLAGQRRLERLVGALDTLVVSGGFGHVDVADDARFDGHVRRLARDSRRVASVCTGASVLAAAGLLDGRRATTHWAFAARLAARYPQVQVDPLPIFVRDGHVATAAGVTSALDLTLAFVEEDHGPDLARHVSRALVTYLQRPGNQAQMSLFTTVPEPEDRGMRRLVDHITTHLGGDLSATALAARAGMSERHLTRMFLHHLHDTPARYVRRVRLEAAAVLLTTTSLPVTAIAARCGFGTTETLRQAFTRRYGASPAAFRAGHSHAAARHTGG
ncbi:DJ-1/PfpI family protein [Rhodococcus ruber]|uniref:GlxA family transcriptional regulator n=1 Tax=Rhodococcus ruber TaxID=1830 RepID=UPI00200FD62E|nr:helix-turn-helix domain-containing protein [Rhodococcus ruber]UQB72724.1 DJ-1/PfpI family protein [Rhodococcus ruber]